MPSALITGANRGLGLEFARQYLADGWQVYAACRDPASASELRQLAEDERRETADPGNGCHRLRECQGGGRRTRRASYRPPPQQLPALCGPRGQTIGNIDYDAWAKVLDVNTMGPMRVSEAFVDNVARSDRKLIVTLTSGMGSIADNTSGGSIAYRSSKAAVNMVMRSLAIDLAPRGITCVVVNPGWVQTDMGGPNATLTPAESVTRLRRLIETSGASAVRQVLQLRWPRIRLVSRPRFLGDQS